ncbi:nucleoside monophosphate kinase [Candidatus Woesearchaeota archaeon]|nr:nucleoside monophosphate kinase [Candidatus Woesearchaeota archaeon]
MIYIITGAPGAGKGTISKIVESDLGLIHVSTGDILRAQIQKGDQLGQEIKALIDAGKFVSDEMIEKIVDNRLVKEDIKSSGAMLDGYPRNIPQSNDLVKNVEIEGLIEVFLEDEVIIKRLSDRRVCPNCGETFHLVSKKPKQENVCDVCSHALIHREDDKPEVIKERLETYHEHTAPIINFFKEKGISYLQLRGDLDLNTQREFIVNQVKNL